jgi:arsenite methyltransferase
MLGAVSAWCRRLRLALIALLLALLAGGCGSLRRFAYEGFGRDRWQQPEQVIEALDLAPGHVVADLGAGGGYFTFRLADAVGPSGHVYAVDIDPDMLAHLERRAREEGYGQVQVVRAEADDPRLPEPVDLVLTVNTYHHLPDRPAYFRNLRPKLRPGGRVAVIDFDGEGWFQRLMGHFVAPEEIRREFEEAGYDLLDSHDFLSRQSFLIFALE